MPSRTLLEPDGNAKLRALWNAFMVFVALALAGALTALVYIAVQNNQNGDLLVDCTTPGHDCYQEGQKRTGEAVGTIQEIIIAANFCALSVEPPQLTDAQFEEFVQCVKEHVQIDR